MRPHSDLPSTRTYIRIFAGLAALTALNTGLSYVPMALQAGVAIKMLIVTFQAGVIAHFLLNLRSENRLVSYTVLAALFLIVSLIGTLIPDIGLNLR